MSARRASDLERRLALLEAEAEVQRTALAAAFAHWEHRRLIAWIAQGAQWLLRGIASPGLRRLALALAVRALKRGVRARTAP